MCKQHDIRGMIDLTDVTNLATVIDWQWVKQWWIYIFFQDWWVIMQTMNDNYHGWYDWYDWCG